MLQPWQPGTQPGSGPPTCKTDKLTLKAYVMGHLPLHGLCLNIFALASSRQKQQKRSGQYSKHNPRKPSSTKELSPTLAAQLLRPGFSAGCPQQLAGQSAGQHGSGPGGQPAHGRAVGRGAGPQPRCSLQPESGDPPSTGQKNSECGMLQLSKDRVAHPAGNSCRPEQAWLGWRSDWLC